MNASKQQRPTLPRERSGRSNLRNGPSGARSNAWKGSKAQGVSPNPRLRETQVLIAHGAPLTRLGLRDVINPTARFRVCAETGHAAHAHSLFLQHRPAVVLLGLTLQDGDGIDLIKDLLKLDPQARMLVLSTRSDRLSVQRAFRAGAGGYVLTTDDSGEVIEALDCITTGGRFASEGVQQCIIDDMAYGDLTPGGTELERLSDRELQVFRGIAAGTG